MQISSNIRGITYLSYPICNDERHYGRILISRAIDGYIGKVETIEVYCANRCFHGLAILLGLELRLLQLINKLNGNSRSLFYKPCFRLDMIFFYSQY